MMKEPADRKALDVALQMLSRRRLTVNQLNERLEKKGFSDPEKGQAIERLLGWGYLNDQEYAYAYCRTKRQRTSRQQVFYELRAEGIARELIEEALRKEYPSEREAVYCRQLWQKERLRSQGHNDSGKDIERMGQRFVRRGYPYELVRQLLNEYKNEYKEDCWDEYE